MYTSLNCEGKQSSMKLLLNTIVMYHTKCVFKILRYLISSTFFVFPLFILFLCFLSTIVVIVSVNCHISNSARHRSRRMKHN